jgi:hypothetical protein
MPCKKRSGLMNDKRAYSYDITTPPLCSTIVDIDISTVNFSQNFTISTCQRLTIASGTTIPLGVTFTNYGTVTYSGGSGGSLIINGSFINYGTFNNTGYQLYVFNNFFNYGIFNNSGSSSVTMAGTNSTAATFKNTGVFNNLGYFYLLIATYLSTFYNYSGGRFINSGTLTINSPEVFNNANGASSCGTGTVTNTGTITGTIGTACPT